MILVGGCQPQVFDLKDGKVECGVFDSKCIADAKQKQTDEREAEKEKQEKWEKARYRCGDYLRDIGNEWYSAGYSNRLYDHCEYKGYGNCWSWSRKISECVKRKCQFEPVYYDKEKKWMSKAYLTKKQFDGC